MKTESIFSLPQSMKSYGTAPVKPTVERITLHCGTEVSHEFYDRNKQAAEAGISKLKADEKRTFRQICGPEHWVTLSVGEASFAGLCGMTMVLRNELPLIPDGKDGRNAQLYVRK
jgi:hypothetical protein